MPLAEKGHRRAQIVLSLLRTRGSVIGAMLIGNNIVNTLLAVYATTVFDSMILNSPLPAWMAPVAASILAIVVLLIGGEVIPKNVAIRYNQNVTLFAAYPCYYFIKLVTPLLFVLNGINRVVIAILGGKESRAGTSTDELLAIVKMSQSAGIIDPMERELIGKSMFLNETKAKEIMIDRTQVCAIPESASSTDIHAIFSRELYSRMPVYRESLDQVVGILNIKEVLRINHGIGEFSVAKVMQAPLVFPETARLGAILEKMRQTRVHMGVVVDEFGGTAGIITLEDIVEQIFGEINDEYDQGVARTRWTGERTLETEGRTSLADLQQELEKKHQPPLSAGLCENAETVAGLVLKHLGRIPASGETFEIETYKFHIKKATGQKIQLIAITFPEGKHAG